jgi:hypothetical protein
MILKTLGKPPKKQGVYARTTSNLNMRTFPSKKKKEEEQHFPLIAAYLRNSICESNH